MGKLLLAMLAMAACTSAENDGIAALRFPIDGSIENAWGSARLDPAGGVPTTFPVTALGIADGTEVQLLAGLSSTGGYPLTTDDDVIIVDPRELATTTVEGGLAEFPHLGVSTGAWTAGSGTVPAELLCGTTVIAARAYEGDATAKRMLAATWLVAVAPACD